MARSVHPDTIRKNTEAMLATADAALAKADEKVDAATVKRDNAQAALDKAIAAKATAQDNKATAQRLLASFAAPQTVAPDGQESAEVHGEVGGRQDALV